MHSFSEARARGSLRERMMRGACSPLCLRSPGPVPSIKEESQCGYRSVAAGLCSAETLPLELRSAVRRAVTLHLNGGTGESSSTV